MKETQTRRELEVLRRMAQIEDDPEESGQLFRERDSWWIDSDRCTRTAMSLLWKGLIEQSDPERNNSYANLTEFGRLAIADPKFVSPYLYLWMGDLKPDWAKRLLDPTAYA